ncbi:MAG: glycosyltransferase, partial [Myxococcales bacterium]|nr:glycosyltransferase [Myxococcales bacterium]
WADVVHLTAVYNFTTFPTLAAARALGKPLIWKPRGADLRWDGARRSQAKGVWDAAIRRTAPKRFAVHVTSEREREAAEERVGARAVVIPNGVVVPDRVDRRADPGGPLRLAFLGRIDPIKGLDRLVDAVARLALPARRNWVLRIAGSGEAEHTADIRARVPPKLQQQVEWLGQIAGAAVDALFADTDLYVQPSHSENFGMSIAEALAHAVPVIASHGTPWERLESERAGWWVPNDVESLRAAIVRAEGMDLEAHGDRGRAWMRREFAWPSVAERFLALARELR